MGSTWGVLAWFRSPSIATPATPIGRLGGRTKRSCGAARTSTWDASRAQGGPVRGETRHRKEVAGPCALFFWPVDAGRSVASPDLFKGVIIVAILKAGEDAPDL